MTTGAIFSRIVILNTAVFLFCALVVGQVPQSGLRSDASSASGQALALAQQSRFADALQLAKGALDRCHQGPFPETCNELTHSLGYIYQKLGESTSEPGERERAFTSARQYYKDVLLKDPGNSAVRFNVALILEESGHIETAIQEMLLAIKSGGRGPLQLQYIVKLGDLYAGQKKMDMALDAYQQAALSYPSAEAPRWRILDLAGHGQGPPLSELSSDCKAWSASNPEPAAACYAQVVRQSYAANPALAEQSFLAWAALLAGQQALSEESLQVLPAQWNSAALAPLRAALRGSPPAPMDAGWWLTGERKKIWAAVLLALGHQFAGRGPAVTERYWKSGLTPLLHELPVPSVALDLERELALLYVRSSSQFDPDKSKLNELINIIFDQKTGAIESGDSEAEQRFHTVLGLVFFEQKKWGGSDLNPRGAAYQLRRTVEVAGQRFRTEGFYQPLPEIKELLAQVYQALANRQKSRSARWESILAYMDSDQPGRALDNLAGFEPDAGFDKEYLSRIIQFRMKSAAGPVSDKDSGLVFNTATEENKTFDSLVSQVSALQPGPGISSDFLKRQQFKMLADLAGPPAPFADPQRAFINAINATDKSAAVSLAAAIGAFRLAVEDHVSLVGITDLARWQQVQYKLVTGVGGRGREVTVGQTGAPAAASLKVTLAGFTISQEVEVAPEVLQAAQIARIVGPEKLAMFGSRMFFEDGKLSVYSDAFNAADITGINRAGIKVEFKFKSQ